MQHIPTAKPVINTIGEYRAASPFSVYKNEYFTVHNDPHQGRDVWCFREEVQVL
jgi:hypothetical protein